MRAQLDIRRTVHVVLDRVGTGQQSTSQLSDIAQQILAVGSPASVGDDRWAFAETLRALDRASKWEPAVEAADVNATAYRNASQRIAEKTLAVKKRGAWSKAVIETLEILANLEKFSDVPHAACVLQCAPIIIPSTSLLTPKRSVSRLKPKQVSESVPTVLLNFTLDDMPVSWPMALQASRLYDIRATAVVDEWPEDCSKIGIEWECSVPDTVLERRGFSIAKDGESSDNGYLIARAEIPPNRGVDLVPLVEIHESNGERHKANVVGQRSLRINTFAPSTLGAGLPMVAQRIVELLAELDARIPSLPPRDRLNLLHLLDASSRFAALANEQKELRGIREKTFQAKLKQALAMDPRIGRRIQEAPKLGGGTTDLLLERIVNELKVSRSPIDLNQAEQLVRQPTQYASAGDCPISILTILDDSPKAEPPGIQSNYMGWVYPPIHGVGSSRIPSMVAVIIIPIGFPVPSAWQRSSLRHHNAE